MKDERDPFFAMIEDAVAEMNLPDDIGRRTAIALFMDAVTSCSTGDCVVPYFIDLATVACDTDRELSKLAYHGSKLLALNDGRA